MKMNRQPILHLLAFKTNVQLAHWQADTLSNAHKTLGDLYDAVDEALDAFTETAIGKTNDREFPEDTCQIAPGIPYSELLAFGLGTVASLRSTCTPGEDDDLLNMAAEISAAINHAKYFLRIE
jgi:hypothetical protein